MGNTEWLQPPASADSPDARLPIGRRRAVRRLAGGALGLAAFPLLDGCGGLARPSAEESVATDRGLGLDTPVAEALYYASLAPSGHNTQPWGVRVLGSNRLLLTADARRRLPAVDPDNRELLLSMGAFLENFVVAAGARGRAAEYEVIAIRSADVELLDVRCTPAAATAYPLGRITTRRTVRKGQLTRAIRPADVSALLAAAGAGSAFFARGSAEARYLDEGTIEANRVQAARDPAQEELAAWVRWRDTDAARHRDGLTPASMEITGLAGFYARHFMDRGSLLTPGNRARGVDAAREQVGEGGGWLVLTSADAAVATLLNTGRRFERVLLGARERMIAVHPMTQMLEEAPFAGAVAGRLGERSPVQFLLRVGYLDRYPDPVSLRRPVRWLVEDLAPASAS